MKTLKTWVAVAATVAMAGAAQAAPVFQGRLADGTASTTCTSDGAGATTKCTSFYLTDLADASFQGFTILNNWNIGLGTWSGNTPPAAGSAQALAAEAGLAATGLDGWLLPTGDGPELAGPLNQYRSIWNAVGGTLTGLQSQFDGVQSNHYWSGTDYARNPGTAWYLSSCCGGQGTGFKSDALYAVAVRPGDVTAALPESQTLALVLLALGATVVARTRRSR